MARTRGRLAAVALVACSRGAHPPPSATERADVGDATTVFVDAAPAPSASAVAPPFVWPADTTRMLVTWVLYPVVERAGHARRRIELVLRAGAAARRVQLDADYTTFYAIDMQRRCREPDAGTGRVAELSLDGGGSTVYAVERVRDELVVREEASSDGLCEPAPCPLHAVEITRVPIPAGVALEERFHVVNGPGDEHDDHCR